tara:strand:+ start:3632 stop:3958 length:327 start_codon:yes stop_codon:yes gene_type:complete
MKEKINKVKRVEHKSKILNALYDRNLIDSNEKIIIASGFENAIIGVSDTIPKKIVYDYWVCIDILLKVKELSFDDAQDWLDTFSLLNNEKEDDESVLFVKTLNPVLNY